MTLIAPVPPAISPAPPVAAPDRRWPIELLWEAEPARLGVTIRGGPLPDDLRPRFGASLEIPLHPDRPTVVANFVATVDGVVALDRAGATGGREISGGFEPDRFLMGLLRATADAVLVGAGTFRASRTHTWTPASVHPPSAGAFAAWRRDLRLAKAPTTVIVSASGRLDAEEIGSDPEQPVLVVTTCSGAGRLATLAERGHVDVVAVGDDEQVPIAALVALLHERGFRLVLSEAGPTLFGELIAARTVDELFLTIAPRLVGRSERARRLGLVEGAGFQPDLVPWARLRSVSRSDGFLFLRYDLAGADRKGV